MSLAGDVLDETGVPRAEQVLRAVAQADLELAREMITNWRRGAGCQSMKLPTGLSRNAIWVVASPLVQPGVRARSIGSTWDWPSLPV